MPSDGNSHWEPTTDASPDPSGGTTFVQAERGGTRHPVRQRIPRPPVGPAARLAAPDRIRHVPDTGPDGDEWTGPPRQGLPRQRTQLRPNLPARQGPPPRDPPVATPDAMPPDGPRRPRHRWWMAIVATCAVALGATAAVLADRGLRTTKAPSDPAASAPPAGSTQPGVTPSGKEGLGAQPTPNASVTPVPGTTTDPAPFFPGSRKTLPGATISLNNGENFAQALARADRTFGPLRMVRVFYPGLPPAWGGSRSDIVNRTVVVSFKAHPREVNAGRHDARLAAWFASVPRDYDVYWAYFHEPENDVESGSFKPADYKAAWRRIAGLANRAGNPKLINTIILMCFTLNPGSGRDFNAYYPGSDLVETLGWDCYNHATKHNKYVPPDDIYGRMIRKSRELGKPWGIAETGSTKIRGDTGAGRAAWLRSMSQYLNAQRPLWVTYYNQVVGGGDFRLLDAPSQQAWKAFCSAAA